MEFEWNEDKAKINVSTLFLRKERAFLLFNAKGRYFNSGFLADIPSKTLTTKSSLDLEGKNA